MLLNPKHKHSEILDKLKLIYPLWFPTYTNQPIPIKLCAIYLDEMSKEFIQL